MSIIDSNVELSHLLEKWEKEFANNSQSPTSLLEKISELIERETEAYIKTDPDPFDDRHPSRSRPDCALGVLLKNLFKNEDFMNKLVTVYVMNRDDFELQTNSCRLMLDILPGLDTGIVFEGTEGLVQRLYTWAETAKEPLMSYATGLLAAAMDVANVAINFKEQNMRLVPIMLQRLKDLASINNGKVESGDEIVQRVNHNHFNESFSPNKNCFPLAKKRRLSNSSVLSPPPLSNECSNSSWAEVEPYMIGSFQMFPLTPEIQQRFILQYLIPMGDYQDLLCHVFEHNALSLILHYINLNENHDIRLAFEALKYLSSLLCHKKFSSEFLNVGGLQRLLQVYRPSVAATGVSICLYYLAYNEDTMEIICSYSLSILQELVSYVLWCLECSHDSSRCHAKMFFSLTFAFRKILEIFDSQDGLRKLMNVIFRSNIFADESEYTDDELFTNRQSARHVCAALKRYYEAHLVIESEHLRRSESSSSSSTSSNSSVARNKAARYTNETIEECVESLLQMMPLRFNWKPVDELIKLDGVRHLIALIHVSLSWNYTGKAETIKSALDVLVVCSVCPKFQMLLTQTLEVQEGQNVAAMRVILEAAECDMIIDSEVRRSALNVIINCCCGPMTRIGCTYGRQLSGSAKKKSFRSGEDLLTKLWNSIRSNNGIMILLNLLMVKTPITHADSIRALACKALCGLARSETVKQIISKLPLFTSGQIQALMKEPILQDKRTEHVKFCKYCIELIERVTGSPLSIDPSPANMTKAEVVAQTKITYNDKEVLQLILKYLVSKGDSIEGLSDVATSLQQVLQHFAANHSKFGPTHLPIVTPTPLPQRISRQIPIVHPNSALPQTPTTVTAPVITVSITPTISSTPPTNNNTSFANNTHSPVTTPIRINRSSSLSSKATQFPKKFVKPQFGSYQTTPVLKRTSGDSINNPQITLDSIITEYLRKQHGLCRNPVVTCPPFSLFVPHRCPEPLNRNAAPVNMAMRLQKREILPRFGGFYGEKFDRKYIYSRFRPVRTYRDQEGSNSFTSCAFSYVDQFLFLGTTHGDLAAFNLHSGALEATYSCHDSTITYIEPSRDGKLILTCSIFRPPVSALWTFTDIFEMKMSFGEDDYVEFSKQTQDKAIGTHNFAAHLYDLNACRLVKTFEDENLSNKYQKNRATLSPTDELILNDGVLWDVRTSSHIHKFDKFNQFINGVFHPNGWEIISNSEIWDLRTYKLLKTVPALDQCGIKFNSTGDVIYGAVFEEESSEDEENRSPYGSSFRTFDSYDYSNIATIDVKRNIFDLAVDPGNCFVAVVENQNNQRDALISLESICRLYEVGRCKEEDDEEADDDEEEEEEENMGDDDSDDDNLGDDENTDDIIADIDSDNGSVISISTSMSSGSRTSENSDEIDSLDNSDSSDDDFILDVL